jgi:RNA polymerase sigma-32 factor
MNNIIRPESNTFKNHYIQITKNIPILSKDEEYILAKNFKEHNDMNAVKKLVESNINYVIKIAKNYSGYGIMTKDLIQEGLIGLMKAIKKFNPDKNIRLISFAIYWIKSEIHEYIIKNLKIVKIASTKTQKKLFFNLKKIKKIGFLNNNEKKSISNLLNVKYKEIDYIESRLNKSDINLDNKDDLSKHYSNILYSDNLKFFNEKIDNDSEIFKKVNKALNYLDDRSKNILVNRWFSKKKLTLKDLSKKYLISPERVRQIESNAIKKLKFLIKEY